MTATDCVRCDGAGDEPGYSPDERTYPCQRCAGTGEVVTAAPDHPMDPRPGRFVDGGRGHFTITNAIGAPVITGIDLGGYLQLSPGNDAADLTPAVARQLAERLTEFADRASARRRSQTTPQEKA